MSATLDVCLPRLSQLKLQAKKWNYNLQGDEVKSLAETQTDANGQILRMWDNADWLNTTESVSVIT